MRIARYIGLAPLITALVFVGACHGRRHTHSNPITNLSDDDILSAASEPYDKAKLSNKLELLGTRAGRKIMVYYPCGDLCPNNTTRHILFDVLPGPKCDRAGGVSRDEAVAGGGGNHLEPFCVPKILASQDAERRQIW